MSKFIDLTGKTFGRLKVIERIAQTGKSKQARWSCICECGNYHSVNSYPLINNMVQSCKCFQRERISASSTTHNMSKTPEYSIWQGIKNRCKNLLDKNYGGRGIKIDPRWEHSFEQFFKDMGKRPPGTSIDRIDNNKSYGPDNCRWATQKEQMNNTSVNKFYAINGESKQLYAWAAKTGIPRITLYNRIKRGVPEASLFDAPYSRVTINEVTQSISGWAKAHGLKPSTVYKRIHLGWPEDKWFLPTK